MITYTKAWWGIGSLAQMYGSALPRTAPISLVAAAFAALLHRYLGNRIEDELTNSYPFQAFAFVVGFLLVFRHVRSCL